MLTPQQTAHWHEQGFLALPGFKPPEALQAVIQRAQEWVQRFETDAPRSLFSTRERGRVADAALLDSAHAVHGFFEEEALDAAGQLRVPQSRSINKIGHALHRLDAVYRDFSHGPELARLAADLGLQQAEVRQSQVIFKQPYIGGEVRWHQDASFFVTEPQSVVTFWFALQDATLDNGCLWVEPGGHRGARGVLREQFVCEEGRLRMIPLDDTPWPSERQALALPVPAGTVLCLNGLLPHFSAANRSPHSRLAYTLHVTDARAAYSPLNWLQPLAGTPPGGLD
jgi:phytanoyl-CoA hydroxylase